MYYGDYDCPPAVAPARDKAVEQPGPVRAFGCEAEARWAAALRFLGAEIVCAPTLPMHLHPSPDLHLPSVDAYAWVMLERQRWPEQIVVAACAVVARGAVRRALLLSGQPWWPEIAMVARPSGMDRTRDTPLLWHGLLLDVAGPGGRTAILRGDRFEIPLSSGRLPVQTRALIRAASGVHRALEQVCAGPVALLPAATGQYS